MKPLLKSSQAVLWSSVLAILLLTEVGQPAHAEDLVISIFGHPTSMAAESNLEGGAEESPQKWVSHGTPLTKEMVNEIDQIVEKAHEQFYQSRLGTKSAIKQYRASRKTFISYLMAHRDYDIFEYLDTVQDMVEAENVFDESHGKR